MKLTPTLVVILLLLSGGCMSKREAERKVHMEEDLERAHKQLEEERARDAYQNSAEYKEKWRKAISSSDIPAQKPRIP